MESAKVVEVKVIVADERIAEVERELGKDEARALEAEQEFWQQKGCLNTFLSDAKHLAKKLKEASGWLASIRQRMIDAHQGG